MTRKEIITELKKYFDIKELVCPHTYFAHRDTAWKFFPIATLRTLLVLRQDIFKEPMTINNYHNGGSYSQRGNRCNTCSIVKNKMGIYLSAHISFQAFDFDVKGLTAEQARKKIEANKNMLIYPVRLEIDVNWVHIDVIDEGDEELINYFKA